MNDRYYIDRTFEDVPGTAEELNQLTDKLQEELMKLEECMPEIADASVGGAMAAGRIDVFLAVDADSAEEAMQIYITCIRGSLHKIGLATPGWDELIHSMTLRFKSELAAA